MKIIIMSGPSGVGKTTVSKILLRKYKKIEKIITTTTRNKRTEEIHGKDYYFMPKIEFNKLIKDNKFIEYAKVHENYYGSSHFEIDRIVNHKHIPLYIVDPQGAVTLSKSLKRFYKNINIIKIFLLPPSYKELENRLVKRDENTPQEIKLRLKEGHEQISHKDFYDFHVVNDNIDKAVVDIAGIVLK